MVMRRAAARSGKWAQHFSNASCYGPRLNTVVSQDFSNTDYVVACVDVTVVPRSLATQKFGGFKSRPVHFQVTALGNLLTPGAVLRGQGGTSPQSEV